MPVKRELHIIVGSVTGTALKVARHLRDNLHDYFDIQLHEYPNMDEILTVPNQTLLICVANTGDGELPPVMRRMYVQLTEQKRDLSEHQYMLINLGDSSYRKYGLAGKVLDDALRRSGARRLENRFAIDALTVQNPETKALEWFMETSLFKQISCKEISARNS